MKSLKVTTDASNYEVLIGNGLRYKVCDLIPGDYSQIYIITDDNVGPLYLDDVVSSFSSEAKLVSYTVPAGESSKSLEVYNDCIRYAIEHSIERDALIIALGGGVVGDLAGFVASTYLRGVDYVQLPTSILAHDSSVGGKVAINHELGKNLIGSFYHPTTVIYDTGTLLTLSDQEWRSGMSEVIKHGFIQDSHLLDACLKLPSFKEVSSSSLQNLLMKGIKVKAQIVAEDEKEKGIRSYLNFGHTLAHALEAEFGYGAITHGEAVAIGMDFAMFVSKEYYSTNQLPIEQYRKWLNHHHFTFSILKDIDSNDLLLRMKRDKKVNKNQIRFVLLSEVGEPELVSFTDDEVHSYIERYLESLSSYL